MLSGLFSSRRSSQTQSEPTATAASGRWGKLPSTDWPRSETRGTQFFTAITNRPVSPRHQPRTHRPGITTDARIARRRAMSLVLYRKRVLTLSTEVARPRTMSVKNSSGRETCHKTTVSGTDLDASEAYLHGVVQSVSKLIYWQVLGISVWDVGRRAPTVLQVHNGSTSLGRHIPGE